MKGIIDEMGRDWLTQAEVDFLSEKGVAIVSKSLDRISDMDKMKAEEPEDEDEELDE